MKILIYVFGIIIFLSCKKETDIANQDTFLEISYLRPGMHFPMALNCNSLNSALLKKEAKHKIVNDKIFMSSFKKEFIALSTEDYQKDVDTRIKLLYHHDSTVDTICMGENFFIAVNGELKKDSPKLLQLIKKEIYK